VELRNELRAISQQSVVFFKTQPITLTTENFKSAITVLTMHGDASSTLLASLKQATHPR
jgi:hypothetical protein